ncbi:uncharacterized protein LOC108700036 isoform X2 [Xenopus laevis]|uniref:Uncharacterized protein LOC108700036 isoform X2 n=1 Tax=Xenopus laevis TaxID=8355 RepID=A0A8J1LL80_XENLA|nr:uncharacterized protein LOC108700036 isoform X2 [Xenopus laevis]XP_041430318.1 uncharacterized protein LOC108700036 isoform X2 [Xenopus laevis]
MCDRERSTEEEMEMCSNHRQLETMAQTLQQGLIPSIPQDKVPGPARRGFWDIHTYIGQRNGIRFIVRMASWVFNKRRCSCRWISRRGLKWEEIVPLVVQKAKECGPPNIIVLHAGGNDVGQCPMKFLIKDIRRDCLRLWTLFPGVVLIWSEIIPRAHWRGAHSHQAVNRARIKINRVVSKFVQGNGGIIVRHMDLEKDRGYFLPDEVHLNDLGLDLFNFRLHEAITLA